MSGSHYVKCKLCGGNCTQKAKLPFYERCLPQPSISLSALLINLAHWFVHGAKNNGIKSSAAKLACHSLLFSLSEEVQYCTPTPLTIYLTDNSGCQFPRPCIGRSVGTCTVVVTRAGFDGSRTCASCRAHSRTCIYGTRHTDNCKSAVQSSEQRQMSSCRSRCR